MLTGNEWLALLVGMLIGMSACGIVFLIGLRIRNSNKNERREKQKLASRQQNVGNRIYNALISQDLNGLIPYEVNVEKFWVDDVIIIMIWWHTGKESGKSIKMPDGTKRDGFYLWTIFVETKQISYVGRSEEKNYSQMDDGNVSSLIEDMIWNLKFLKRITPQF